MTDARANPAQDETGLRAYGRDFSVAGRVALVTGAGQGIGREFARQFAAAGAIAIVADVNIDNARSVAAEIEAAGGQALAVVVDVGDKDSVDAMVAAAKAKYGRVDILVNNASLFTTLKKQPFDEIPVDVWERTLRVNVTGSFLCAAAVAQTMRDQKWGRIINVSSASIARGTPNYLHYVTSKAAVVGMNNSLARELGPYGVTVNALRPGTVATEVKERVASLTPEVVQRAIGQQCVPRGMVPTDLVGLVLFLCSPAGEFITGQTIAVDGGYTHF